MTLKSENEENSQDKNYFLKRVREKRLVCVCVRVCVCVIARNIMKLTQVVQMYGQKYDCHKKGHL